MVREERLSAQESVFRIADIPGDLNHPRLVGTGAATGEVHSSARDSHDDEQVASDQAGLGPGLNGREVNGGQDVPVGLAESLPGRLPFPSGRRFEAVCFQDVGDRPVPHAMPRISQGAWVRP